MLRELIGSGNRSYTFLCALFLSVSLTHMHTPASPHKCLDKCYSMAKLQRDTWLATIPVNKNAKNALCHLIRLCHTLMLLLQFFLAFVVFAQEKNGDDIYGLFFRSSISTLHRTVWQNLWSSTENSTGNSITWICQDAYRRCDYYISIQR